MHHQLITEALEVSRSLEAGQAESPLTGHLESLAVGPSCQTIAALALSDAALRQMLTWLAGAEHHVLSFEVPKGVGWIRLRFQDRGFAYEGASGVRQEFSNLGGLLDALRSSDVIQAGDGETWAGPLEVMLEGGRDATSLEVLVLQSVEALENSPGLVAHLAQATNRLLIAGEAGHALVEAQRVRLEPLVTSMDLIQPIVVGVGVGPETAARGWWRARPIGSQQGCLPPITWSDEPPEFSGLVGGAKGPLSAAADALFRVRRSRSALDLLHVQCAQEHKRLAIRRSHTDRKSRALEDRDSVSELRSSAERAKALLQDRQAELAQGLEERAKRAQRRGGALAESLPRLADEVGEFDLRRETTATAIRLSLEDRILEGLSNETSKLLRAELRGDLVLLRDGLDALREELESALAAEQIPGASLEVELPDERELWASVRDLVDVEVRYKGELPKRGLAQRFSEGRRPMYLIMMGISMFGAPFGLQRGPGVAILLLLLFVFGFVNTYRSWRRQDSERIAKEIDRIHDQLRSQLERLTSEVQREKLGLLGRHLAEQVKRLQRQLDRAVRNAGDLAAKSLDRERGELRSRGRALEQKLKDASERERLAVRLSEQAVLEVAQAERALAEQIASLTKREGRG